MIKRLLALTLLFSLTGCVGMKMSLPVTDDNWLTTSSGLMYKVIKEGRGGRPTANSKVTIMYEGQLLDGTICDSSYAYSYGFPLRGAIKGWTEGIQLMSHHAIYVFKIPPHLGYGDRAHKSIPANSTVIYKINLIDFF